MSAVKATSSAMLLALVAAQGEEAGVQVTLHKAGFPERLVNQRPACGELNATKSLLNPEYWAHLMSGFRQGPCSAAGYTHFEHSESASETRRLPFSKPHNVTVNVWTRDPNAIDVVECMAGSCKAEMAAVVKSGYTHDVAKCISPAFGPCVPKAWACLGDDNCRTALKCMPEVAAKCGKELVAALSDKAEREKLMCIQNCKGSKTCVLEKCGKEAVECLIGTDKLCHDALVCLPEGMASCSKPAFECLFSKDGICRENMLCLAEGANTCADPAVNALTDKSIADMVLCANQKCPSVTPVPADVLTSTVALPHYPEQLACMGLHCTGKVFDLLKDKDVAALTGCLPQAVEECSADVWQCMGEDKCLGDFRCWTTGLAGAAKDVWKMVTDGSERAFDKELMQCITDCTKEAGPIKRATCLVGKCGVKAAHCLADATCRKLLEDLPATAAKCGPESVKELLNKNSTFSKAIHCGMHVGEQCGSEAVELLRDANVANLVQCNAQCTRAPSQESIMVV